MSVASLRRGLAGLAVAGLAFSAGCRKVPYGEREKRPAATEPLANEQAAAKERPAPKFVQKGVASWYGAGFSGRRTASGERYNPDSLTAAHRTLPFGSRVKVVNLSNDRAVIVRITNRGPYVRGRVIDLSRAAARELRMTRAGIARVRVESLPEATGQP